MSSVFVEKLNDNLTKIYKTFLLKDKKKIIFAYIPFCL